MDINIPNSEYSNVDEPFAPLNNNCMNLLNWNVRSLPRNFKLFTQMHNMQAFDILCLCETRLDKNIDDSFDIINYTAFHQPRNRMGGGVSMYIKDRLRHFAHYIDFSSCSTGFISVNTFLMHMCHNFCHISNPPFATFD